MREKSSIEWRTGFVRTWKEKTGNCAEEFFRSASRDGWEKGKEAGVWDASSECPAYPHPRGVKQCVTKFRAAWRLGWYKSYYGGSDASATRYGSIIGRRDACKLAGERWFEESH